MLIPSGYGQINFKYTGAAVPLGAEWTVGFENVGGDTPQGIAAQVASTYNTVDIESVIGNGCDLTSILVKLGPNETGPSFELAVNIVSDGGAPSDSPGTSTLVHKNTAFGGRAGRGRIYLPCTPDAGVALGGQLTGTYPSEVNTRMEDFLEGMATLDVPLVLLHGSGSPLGSPTPILSLSVDSRVATQRRRNRR